MDSKLAGLKVFWPLLPEDQAPPLTDSLLIGWFLDEVSPRPQNATVVLAPTPSETNVPTARFLNVVVVAFISITDNLPTADQLESLLRSTSTLKKSEKDLCQTLDCVGVLTVHGTPNSLLVRKIVANQRVKSSRLPTDWWIEMTAGGTTAHYNFNSPSRLSSDKGSRWPRVEDVLSFNWTTLNASVEPPIRLVGRVKTEHVSDLLFYTPPNDAFYYSSSPANTVGLLRSVADDAQCFARTREGKDCHSLSSSCSDFGSGLMPVGEPDPFEILLRELNVSSYVAVAISDWKPEPDYALSPKLPIPVSPSAFKNSPLSRRRKNKKHKANYSSTSSSLRGGKWYRAPSLSEAASLSLEGERSDGTHPTVTPEGRALTEPITWTQLLIKVLLGGFRIVMLPLVTILALIAASICRVSNLHRMSLVEIHQNPISVFVVQVLVRVKLCAQWPAIWLRMENLRRASDRAILAATGTECISPTNFDAVTSSNLPLGTLQSLRLRLGYNVLVLSSATLILVDLIMGWLFAWFLMTYPHLVLNFIHKAYKVLHIDVLRAQVNWLKGYPAGLKLNKDLSMFIGELLLILIDTWNELTTLLAPMEPLIVRSIAFVSLCGASFLMAITLDILAFCTLHVFYIYYAVSQLTRVMLRSLGSLSYLFRGCKWNTLRCRVDSCEYSLDQLLVGSVAFTCLLLLLPTILVFYISFVTIWLIILFTQSILQFALACLNHFPLYLLGLIRMSSVSLPSGVTVYPLTSDTLPLEGNFAQSYWILKANSVSIKDSVMRPFLVGLHLQFAPFNPWKICLSVLSGRIITLHGTFRSRSGALPSMKPGGTIAHNELKPFHPQRTEDEGVDGNFLPFVMSEFTLPTARETRCLILDCLTGSRMVTNELMVRRRLKKRPRCT